MSEGCTRRCLYGPPEALRVRPAMYGRLCTTCYRRLRDHLVVAGPVLTLMQSMVGKTLQAVAYGDKVQTSLAHSLPFHVEQAERVSELEEALKGWAKEAFRVLPLNLLDDLPDVDTGQGAVAYLNHRLGDIVTLPFIGEIHDELIPLIRAGLKSTGQERMPLEALDSMCPICLERTTQVDWVGDGPDPMLQVTCKKCRLVIDGGSNGYDS